MSQELAVHQGGLDVDLIRRTIAPTVTKDEFDFFIARCKQSGLDPVARQIYAISRYDFQAGGNKMTIQVSIDGMRLLAERSGKYAGQIGPLYCGDDMIWQEVWLSSKPPRAAKVGVMRSDFKDTLWAVAKYDSYLQTKKDGSPMGLWAKMPDTMLAKCAESLALRRAFPAETSGFYTREEMGQSENETVIDGHATIVEEGKPVSANGQRPQEQPTSALQRMIDIATRRAEALSLSFEDVKREAGVEPDVQLVASSFTKINGWLTNAEKEAKAQPA
jgi:phage recombination protein Bet